MDIEAAKRIEQRLSRSQSPAARSSGEAYAREGRVHIESLDEELLRARVIGTQEYDVEIAVDGTLVTHLCNCATWRDSTGPCKHVWAAWYKLDSDLHGAPPQ